MFKYFLYGPAKIFEPIPVDKMSMFSKEELIYLLQGEQKIRQQLEITTIDFVRRTLS